MRRLETRQQRVDKWLGDPPNAAPIRMMDPLASSGHSRSEPSLSSLSATAAAQASREVYEQHGFLVGRSKGTTADGYTGARPRRHDKLSFNSMLFNKQVVGSKKPRKESKQWRLIPENSFVWDPRRSLPVPRGGWDSQPPAEWPTPVPLRPGHVEALPIADA